MLASKTILPRIARCAALPATRAPFSSSRVLSHKESSSSTFVPFQSEDRNQPCNTGREKGGRKKKKKKKLTQSDTDDDVDKHKLDSLRKHKDGAAHWKRELASDSEEAVKADRGHGAAKESVEELQHRTKKLAEDSKQDGTSRHEGM
ncbi:hypothetical protein PWT90_09676 [Aphanocladium album]|nr:hypothetical protein PWT90_09676 [Aphanocladium album]